MNEIRYTNNDNMNKWFSAILVLIPLILSELCFALENTSVRSPIYSGTVPPSSYSNGLANTPNPMDSSSNLVITGNVTGGKHFRGLVPYGSSTNFQAPLGTSSLDSFLRYSAEPVRLEGFTDDSAGLFTSPAVLYRPFFSPTATVATSRAGLRGDILTLTTVTNQARLEPGRESRVSTFTSASNQISSTWPFLSRSPQEMDRLISEELGTELSAPSLYVLPSARGQDTSLVPPSSSIVSGETRPIDKQRSGKPVPFGSVFDAGLSTSVYPTNSAQLDQLISQVEERSWTRSAQTNKSAGQGTEIWGQGSGVRGQKIEDRRQKTEDRRQEMDEGRGTRDERRHQVYSIEYQASSIESGNNTEEKFGWYMRAADTYLKQGRYYRAADSYTMALVYKPDDGLAYAGKSHALFAAGEYVTSTLFLFKALQVMPEYAGVKVDLAGIIGDRSRLDSRIRDVEERLQISGSSVGAGTLTAQLQLLLGYVYYQLDRLDDAKKVIEAASKKLPSSVAVGAVKKVIEDAISRCSTG